MEKLDFYFLEKADNSVFKVPWTLDGSYEMMKESVIKRVCREFLRLLIQLSLTDTMKFVVTKRYVRCPMPERNENILIKRFTKRYIFIGFTENQKSKINR